MAPLLRRSWALRGHPSTSKYQAGHRDKVSVAAALWLPPLRDRLHLAYQTLVNGYFTNVEVAEFLSCAVQGLPGPVIALWDGGVVCRCLLGGFLLASGVPCPRFRASEHDSQRYLASHWPISTGFSAKGCISCPPRDQSGAHFDTANCPGGSSLVRLVHGIVLN
jgi:hypothetical protein